MTTQEFSQIDRAQQRRCLLEAGAYIGHRKQAGWSVLLYQLESFYVEVFFAMTTLEIDRIEAFDDLDRLEPYLERISICALLTV